MSHDAYHPPADDVLTLAWAETERHNLDVAIKHFKKAIAKNPDLANAYNGLGFCYAEKGVFSKALKSYRIAFAIAEDQLIDADLFHRRDLAWWEVRETRPFLRAIFGIGRSLAGLEEFREAAKQFHWLIKLDQLDHQDAHWHLGWLNHRVGYPRKALKHYRSHAAEPHALLAAGLAYHQLGQPVEAVRAWRRGFFANIHLGPLVLGQAAPAGTPLLLNESETEPYARRRLTQHEQIWNHEARELLARLLADDQVQKDVWAFVRLREALACEPDDVQRRSLRKKEEALRGEAHRERTEPALLGRLGP